MSSSCFIPFKSFFCVLFVSLGWLLTFAVIHLGWFQMLVWFEFVLRFFWTVLSGWFESVIHSFGSLAVTLFCWSCLMPQFSCVQILLAYTAVRKHKLLPPNLWTFDWLWEKRLGKQNPLEVCQFGRWGLVYFALSHLLLFLKESLGWGLVYGAKTSRIAQFQLTDCKNKCQGTFFIRGANIATNDTKLLKPDIRRRYHIN